MFTFLESAGDEVVSAGGGGGTAVSVCVAVDVDDVVRGVGAQRAQCDSYAAGFGSLLEFSV